MRGLSDLYLLETLDENLLREVTGLELEPSGHALIDVGAGVRFTQRLAIGDVGGAIWVFTWPAELQPQAKHLYSKGRGRRLLAAAEAGGWEVDARPHLAFWLSNPEERLYLNPTISVEHYVDQWSGEDFRRIGQHDADTVRPSLWPWLIERGYASEADEAGLGAFVARLRRKKRAAHLRPGLRLRRQWPRDQALAFREQGQLADEIRIALNQLLAAVDDPPLPAQKDGAAAP